MELTLKGLVEKHGKDRTRAALAQLSLRVMNGENVPNGYSDECDQARFQWVDDFLTNNPEWR